MILWQASDEWKQNCRLTHYMGWLARERGLHFDAYEDLRRWSTEQYADFWESLWHYFDIQSDTPYERVVSGDPMPHAKWFEGARINYAAHIFRACNPEKPALVFVREDGLKQTISWSELERQTAAMATWLRKAGVQKGDRVAGFLPNIPEAIAAFLASASIGAVWSSCSPDFGVASVVERFQQIQPKILIAADGYLYGGKTFDRSAATREIAAALPGLERIIYIPYIHENARLDDPAAVEWKTVMNAPAEPLRFEPLPFDHPVYILYSSGTTGAPKAITHGHGGVLLEHLKYLAFHNDLQRGETFFWFTTTGWMMWNFAISALLHGASVLLYDGSPAYPDLNTLWRLADETPVHHFGTSAAFLVSCMKAACSPRTQFSLSALRSLGSTGSPLPPEAFGYIYDNIKKDLWLASMSGGTDVCTAWVGGCPLLPVYEGEIQTRCLGCDMESYDERGLPVRNEVGEMVVLKPMPSMPVFFWNDPDFARYKSSYFEDYAGIWRHGDWLKITDRGTCIIYGRSDATLNRHGIRIGTAEIYRVLDTISSIRDALIVNLELKGGRHFMPLFVTLAPGATLDETLCNAINTALRQTYSPRHVPDEIVAVPDIPYTISGKKMEAPVKKILLGIAPERAANLGSMRNPEAMEFFTAYGKRFEGNL